MPRVGDVNLSPLEYADSIRAKVDKISPSRLYTYRYIWQTDEKESLSVSVITATLKEHEVFRSNLVKNEHVLSATTEYISEIDCNYLLLVETVVQKKEEKKEESK